MQWLANDRIGLSRISTGVFSKIINNKKSDEAFVYLATREGRMLYSNDKDITSANFASRQLVQDFIQTPLAQGQTEFNDANGVRYYGFFKDIGDTNLILFAEVERAKALASVREIVVQFLGVLAGILLLFVIALQLSLRKIIGPLKDLVQLAGQIGRGNFAVEFGTAGVGEVMSLNNAFKTMVGHLVERDRAIQNLMAEQLEKIRLEGELKIAQGIQANLLPTDRLPEELGLDVFAKYIPATECAGDWYGYHHNPGANETIVTIADVSGHGAGSSMFTAMIAGLFDQHKSTSKGPWDIEKFAQDVNGVILRLGKKQWHATMLLLRYRHATQDADLLFAGHNPPFIQHSTEDIPLKRLRGTSTVLGLEEKATCYVTQIPFKAGTTMLMFTDGLVEANNPAGKKLGDKKVLKTFQSVRTDSATQIVNRVVVAWDQHRSGTPAADDMCVMAIRAAS
jgi:sigma-B regulation protein RsbU (phosphoserine phosphatase)